jgi:hypothetical protein
MEVATHMEEGTPSVWLGQSGVRIDGVPPDASQDDRAAKVGLIEAMLDYAMIGGAELGLPCLVLLLRAARLELLNSTASDADAVADDQLKPDRNTSATTGRVLPP